LAEWVSWLLTTFIWVVVLDRMKECQFADGGGPTSARLKVSSTGVEGNGTANTRAVAVEVPALVRLGSLILGAAARAVPLPAELRLGSLILSAEAVAVLVPALVRAGRRLLRAVAVAVAAPALVRLGSLI
jgi:hypothetical protein